MDFKLESNFKPTGDQPQAIEQLVKGVEDGLNGQVLMGVTGSGKTFTIANAIAKLNRPTLILSHNKTLAAQLYGEFKQFFPHNAVEYFVSYYDYYQPEAFIPSTNTYIEKDLQINDEIDKLRLSTTSSLVSGRRDVIVVSSVSCIYSLGNPADITNNIVMLTVGQNIDRDLFLRHLVNSLYSRNEMDFQRGTFRVKGDTVDVHPANTDFAYRISFWGDEVESIDIIDPMSGTKSESLGFVKIYPANIFVTDQNKMKENTYQIQDDLVKQMDYFNSIDKPLEAKRLEDRVTYDLEMIKELGYCSGIENYSRYFDGRKVGERPYVLLDFFPDDFLMVVDESHVSLPQIRAMYGGDKSRKTNLVEYGFRLPSAMDNRPLIFDEFEQITKQTIYVSATPADYELQRSEGVIVEQVIRPTGLLDPIIEVRPSGNQVDDLLNEIELRIEKKERVLVTTLTKRMAEELNKYLVNLSIKSRYIHSEVDTLERVEILRELRLGSFDVLIGVNLLREGLDLPEVSLVAILDADKEGFLRSARSLTQTAGRAARNVNSLVIFYADKVTNSMQKTIDETNRRRSIQIAYNEKHGVTPTQIIRSTDSIMTQTAVADSVVNKQKAKYDSTDIATSIAADPVVKYMNSDQLKNTIKRSKQSMARAVKELDFIEAARYRDEINEYKKLLDNLN
ncbi:MAG: excinuclease ABC subunit UvrB [Bacteroidales bacterium]|nr:excinuclease ABC subunit UvrB [Bacteroidales bacterium]